MSDRTRLGLHILGGALVLGLVGDLLLRAFPWGLNLPLFTVALVTAGAWLVRRFRIPVSGDAPWLALTALMLGVAFVGRDAPMLRLLDVVGLLGTLALATLSMQGAVLRLRGLAEYLRAAAGTFASAGVGILPLIAQDIRWAEIPQTGRLRQARGVGLGLLLAFPFLLAFGGLFMAADSTFENVVGSLLHVDVELIASHTFLFGVLTVLAGGYLRGALVRRPPAAAPASLESVSLSILPVGTALGLLNLLFLLFVVVQAPYFFGGLSVVERTGGLTLAEFARRGFFELVMVSALVLPVLLGADWLVRNAAPRHVTSFRALAGLLLLQVGAVMASALLRMALYVEEFGLSQDRLYATVFMGYLAAVSAWFAWTCLRGLRHRFAFGALQLGYAVLAALHVVNVDGVVVRTNVARAVAGAEFDVRYHTRALSADAVSSLLASRPQLSLSDRAAVDSALQERWGGGVASPSGHDWRSWNYAAARARTLLRKD